VTVKLETADMMGMRNGVLILFFGLVGCSAMAHAQNWPAFRGAHSSGIGDGQAYPQITPITQIKAKEHESSLVL